MACSLTPFIKISKPTDSRNSSTLSIFSLNLFKYTHVDSLFYWVTPNSFMELFVESMFVLKCVTNLAQR